MFYRLVHAPCRNKNKILILLINNQSYQQKKGAQLDYIKDINKFIIDNFLFGDDNTIESDASLLENGIIDSTGVLELISFLEETYEIIIEDDEMIPENLDSMKNISDFLNKKITA